MDWVLGMAGLVVLALLVTWWVYGRRPGGGDAPGHAGDTKRPPRVDRRALQPPQPPSPAAATALASPTTPAPAPPHQQPFRMRWCNTGAVLQVAGFRIDQPGLYITSGTPVDRPNAADGSEIHLEAEVRRPTGPVPELPYWPWYLHISPEQRWVYLSWLASGRRALPPEDGYMFMYLYGLERRMLLENADRSWCLKQVVRLRELDRPRIGTKHGASFRRYTANLLWFELASAPKRFDAEALHAAIGLTERWTPELLAAPLYWLLASNQRLPADVARLVASINPQSQRGVVITRVPEQFNELFAKRYHEAFGEGLELLASKRDSVFTYRPASNALPEMRCTIKDPLDVPSQFKKLPKLWNSCVEDLRRLSRVTAGAAGTGNGAGSGAGPLTVEAWEALPAELRETAEHPLAAPLAQLAAQAGRSPNSDDAADESREHLAVVPAGTLATLAGLKQRETLTSLQATRLAETVALAGFGLEPDARLTGLRYRWDEPVALVPGLEIAGADQARYAAASCVLRLGMSVALADGSADEVEVRVLGDQINAVLGLSSAEQQRLAVLRQLLRHTGADIGGVAGKLRKHVPQASRSVLGRLLVVIAATTDRIDREERAALRRAFRALDLPAELLEKTIAQVAPEAAEDEVVVKPATPAARAGEPIPPPAPTDDTARPVAPPGLRLNYAAISSIMAETRQVSALLAEAMSSEADDDAPAAPAEPGAAATVTIPAAPIPQPATPAATPPASSPPSAASAAVGRYGPLLEALAAQPRWARPEADRLARGKGLMLDAGVEAINDWAMEHAGGPVIEEQDDELVVDQHTLQQALSTGGQNA